MAASVVARGPLALEQRLRLAVLRLLPEIGADRAPPSVHHDGGRGEADRPPALLQAPAHVDVVARDPKLGIEPVDREQRRTTERHVAARYVLRYLVGEKDVDRPAGTVRHSLLHEARVGRRDVRASEPHVVAAREAVRQVAEPVRVREGVVVGERDELAGGRIDAGVPGRGEAAVLRAD
jgi:hypothetical protein